MAAGLATFREVLTRANYEHVDHLNERLVDGYHQSSRRLASGVLARAE